MFSHLRKQFGTAGLIVAIVALVAALAGGAYAASGGLTGKQKKEVKSIAKSFQGQGPKGDAGAPGTPGGNGAPGKDGTNGTNGSAGLSVEAEAAGAECAEGGTKFKIGGVTKGKACNGEEGPEGPEGSPWTAGGVLPSKATETGTYSFGSETGSVVEGESVAITNISFPVPLPAPIAGSNAVFVPTGPAPAECESDHAGAADVNNPEADPGFLCVYLGFALNMSSSALEIFTPGFGLGAGVSGAILQAQVTAPEAFSIGSWAVTAP